MAKRKKVAIKREMPAEDGESSSTPNEDAGAVSHSGPNDAEEGNKTNSASSAADDSDNDGATEDAAAEESGSDALEEQDETTDDDASETNSMDTAEPAVTAEDDTSAADEPEATDSETETDEATESEADPDAEEENGEENAEGEEGEEEDNDAPEDGDATLPLAAVVEAVLFAAREPLKPAQIARAVGKRTRQEAIKDAVGELNVHYLETGRAFEIAEISGRYQLMSRPEFAPHIMKIYPKRELSGEKEKVQRLTPAALDTLAIIAYKQPVTRAEIEHIRGVGCGPVLKALLERDSIRIAGKRLDMLGQPLVYGTTENFLAEFGLGSLDELPMRNDFLAILGEEIPPVEVMETDEGGDETAPTDAETQPADAEAENASEEVAVENEDALPEEEEPEDDETDDEQDSAEDEDDDSGEDEEDEDDLFEEDEDDADDDEYEDEDEEDDEEPFEDDDEDDDVDEELSEDDAEENKDADSDQDDEDEK